MEATQSLSSGFNHGKFLVGLFDADERDRYCAVDAHVRARDPHDPMNPWPSYAAASPSRLLSRCGWSPQHVFVMDLQTGEGAMFSPGGSPSADLTKHQVWVCPMFEPFLGWLYEHIAKGDVAKAVKGEAAWGVNVKSWFDGLPEIVELPDAPCEMYGFRRPGPGE